MWSFSTKTRESWKGLQRRTFARLLMFRPCVFILHGIYFYAFYKPNMDDFRVRYLVDRSTGRALISSENITNHIRANRRREMFMTRRLDVRHCQLFVGKHNKLSWPYSGVFLGFTINRTAQMLYCQFSSRKETFTRLPFPFRGSLILHLRFKIFPCVIRHVVYPQKETT